MKIAIAYPPLEGKGCPMLGQNRQFQWFHNPSFIYPMVPASAATLLQTEGHEVSWLDGIAEQWCFNVFMEKMQERKPDLIAIETKTPVVRSHWKIIQELKEQFPRMSIVLMGDHVTALPEESFHECPVDFVITGGDYDFLLGSITRFIEGRGDLNSGIFHRRGDEILQTGPFTLQEDLDTLPFIDRELTRWSLYGEKLYKLTPFTYTMVGRDCPYAKCTFCSWTTLFPKFRTRSPESLLDEIEMLVTRYGIKEIFDDTGTFPSGKWLTRFCQGMIERGLHRRIIMDCNFRFDYLTPDRARMMKESGFRLLKLGLESANQETLDRLRKNTKVEDITGGCRIAKESGLDVHLTIMVGYPWENRQQAQDTLNLAKQLMKSGLADMLQSTIPIPYPGSPLYQQAVENNWLRFGPNDYERFDMTQPVFRTPDLSPKEIMEICDQIYRIFLHPRYLFQQFKKIRDVDQILYYLRGVKPVIGHIFDFMRTSQ